MISLLTILLIYLFTYLLAYLFTYLFTSLFISLVTSLIGYLNGYLLNSLRAYFVAETTEFSSYLLAKIGVGVIASLVLCKFVVKLENYEDVSSLTGLSNYGLPFCLLNGVLFLRYYPFVWDFYFYFSLSYTFFWPVLIVVIILFYLYWVGTLFCTCFYTDNWVVYFNLLS